MSNQFRLRFVQSSSWRAKIFQGASVIFQKQDYQRGSQPDCNPGKHQVEMFKLQRLQRFRLQLFERPVGGAELANFGIFEFFQ